MMLGLKLLFAHDKVEILQVKRFIDCALHCQSITVKSLSLPRLLIKHSRDLTANVAIPLDDIVLG